MAENRTKSAEASVHRYLAAIEDEARRKDCNTLARLMGKATKQEARMWGTSIVGFGTLRYKYESGREGETCLVGFSSRKGDISIYGTASSPRQQELLGRLGKHKRGKGCLYIGKLRDVDLEVLEQLVTTAVCARGKRLD
jgi:hypothetical protein